MPVFKLYLKIIRSKAGLICLYVGIFLLLALFMSANAKKDNVTGFVESKTSITIADRDNSVLSKHIIDYLSKNHEVVTADYDRAALQDTLYYNQADYILIIPNGLQDSYTASDNQLLSLENIKEPRTQEGYLVDSQLEEYLSLVRTALHSGITVAEACEQTDLLLQTETTTEFLNTEQANKQLPSIYYYFQFFPYAFLSLITVAFGTALISIWGPEVRKRNYCSALPLRKFNAQLGIVCVGVGMVLLLLLCVLGVVVFHDHLDLIQPVYLACNLISFAIVCMSIGLLCGLVAKTSNVLTMLANIISLTFSFLGGVFVEQEFLSAKVLPLSKVLPSYWYIQNNDMIFQNLSLNSTQIQTFIRNCSLQLVFAFAVFAAAMLVSNQKASAQKVLR